MPRTAEIAAALRARIMADVHLGQAAGTERLPGVRALAAEFDADHRTILAALRRLSDEGLVEMRPRSGIYVALPQAWPLLPDSDDEWLVDSVMVAFRRRVTPRELAERVVRITMPVRHALCIESTDEHRRILCDEVHNSYGFRSSEMDVAEMETRGDLLLEADFIVTTMFHMVEVTAAAKKVGTPVFMMSMEAEVGRVIYGQLSLGEVFFIGTDPRIAEKIETALKATGLAANARAVIAGVDDPDAIPSDRPVYVFPSAIALVKSSRVLARATVLRYEFPDSVARHLLRWLTRNGNAQSLSSGDRNSPGQTAEPAT
jgi:DNA-binding transcriptional regulator YhcF (GntR family)